MKQFKLTEQYLGYQTKKDITNVDVRFLGRGSKNVLINDGEKVVSSPGYTLYGPSSTSVGGSNKSYDWMTSKGFERNLRVLKSGKIQIVYNNTFIDLFSFTAGKKPRFAEWWSDTEKDDLLIFVAGDANIYSWSGGMAEVLSATSNTITKKGTTSWKEEKFLISGGSNVITIDGTDYTYTGGANTTTLTGVTPSPAAVAAGKIAVQKITTSTNKPASGVTNDYIHALKNQIYIGSDTSRSYYISKNSDYTSFTFSSPRLPGEGALLTLDGTCKGMVTHKENMYISAGRDMWFQVVFTLSSDNTKEDISIQKLQSSPFQAAVSQELISSNKDLIVYLSQEKIFDTLGRLETIDTKEQKPISYPIKDDLKKYDLTDGNIVFFQNQHIISLPAESIVLIYDYENNYWQPPQSMNVILSVINGVLYGHSTLTDETYLLFDETNYTHNGNPIESIAAMVYNGYGVRTWQKRFDEYYWEGYATLETKLDIAYKYDFGGHTMLISDKTIDMSNQEIMFYTESDGSFGKVPLGKNPLGTITDSDNNLPKFRAIHSLNKVGFYEMQTIIKTNKENYRWEIIAHGPNTLLSTADNINIKI